MLPAEGSHACVAGTKLLRVLDLVFSPSAAAVVGTSEELWHDAVVRWTLTALVDRCALCRPGWCGAAPHSRSTPGMAAAMQHKSWLPPR